MADINLNLMKKYAQEFQNLVKATGEAKVDEKTFSEKITNDRSIFERLDINWDGKISEDEINTVLVSDSNNDGIVTDTELTCMKDLMFFARRDVDKWFTLDINRDGHFSNVEEKLGDKGMFGEASTKDTSLDLTMTNEELSKLYNMEEVINDPNNEQLEQWLNSWLEEQKQTVREKFGIELSEKQIILIKKEQIKQLNTWLFKTGDNATDDAPLYNSLNCTAYTRLVTTNQSESCCHGEITPPPATEDRFTCSLIFSPLQHTPEQYEKIFEKSAILEQQLANNEISKEDFDKQIEELFKLENNATEVKNRLAWSMFITPPEELLSTGEDAVTVWEKMTDEQYNYYHQQYQSMRDMTAADFRELLKPENEQKRIEFEKNSAMTVKQIVDYIDIVEQQIGVGNFDNEDWSVDNKQYFKITFAINGTESDNELLKGKTRKDIPDNRKKLLRFLEEKGWLYEQFKF